MGKENKRPEYEFLAKLRREVERLKKIESDRMFIHSLFVHFFPWLINEYYAKPLIKKWEIVEEEIERCQQEDLLFAEKEMQEVFLILWQVFQSIDIKLRRHLKRTLVNVLRELRKPGNCTTAHPVIDRIFPTLRALYVLYVSKDHNALFCPISTRLLSIKPNPFLPLRSCQNCNLDFNAAFIWREFKSLKFEWENKVRESINWDRIMGDKKEVFFKAHRAFLHSKTTAIRSDLCFINDEKLKILKRSNLQNSLEFLAADIERSIESTEIRGPQLKSRKSEKAAEFIDKMIIEIIEQHDFEGRKKITYPVMVKKIQKMKEEFKYPDAVTLTLTKHRCREFRRDRPGFWCPRGQK